MNNDHNICTAEWEKEVQWTANNSSNGLWWWRWIGDLCNLQIFYSSVKKKITEKKTDFIMRLLRIVLMWVCISEEINTHTCRQLIAFIGYIIDLNSVEHFIHKHYKCVHKNEISSNKQKNNNPNLTCIYVLQIDSCPIEFIHFAFIRFCFTEWKKANETHTHTHFLILFGFM